jgi:hypothetical protein
MKEHFPIRYPRDPTPTTNCIAPNLDYSQFSQISSIHQSKLFFTIKSADFILFAIALDEY